MDEHLAAVIISIVTGLFGFIGIIATALLANKKAKKVTDSTEVEVDTLVGEARYPRVDYFATIRADLKENGIVAREGITNVRQDVSDLKLILREHVQEDRLLQEALLAELRKITS